MQFYQSNAFYPGGNQNTYDQWKLVNTIEVGYPSTCLTFDKHEELLWSGSENVILQF
jgi:hypothetical protein